MKPPRRPRSSPVDNFNVDTGTASEVARANAENLRSLQEQARLLEHNADLAKQYRMDVQATRSRGGRRRASVSGGSDDFELQPVSGEDPFMLQPAASNGRGKSEKAFDELLRHSMDRQSRDTKVSYVASLINEISGVKGVRGAAHFLEGSLNPRAIRGAAEFGQSIVGEGGAAGKALGGIAGIMGSVALPVFIGTMIFEKLKRDYQEQTDKIAADATMQRQRINQAEQIGLDPALRRHLDREVKNARTIATPGFREMLILDYEFTGRKDAQKVVYDTINDPMRKRLMARIDKDRALGIDQDDAYYKRLYDEQVEDLQTARKYASKLGVNADRVSRRNGGKAMTNEEFNASFDKLLLEVPVSVVRRKKADDEQIDEAEKQHELRLQRDPKYAATWRNRENLTKEIEQQQIMQHQGWNDY